MDKLLAELDIRNDSAWFERVYPRRRRRALRIAMQYLEAATDGLPSDQRTIVENASSALRRLLADGEVERAVCLYFTRYFSTTGDSLFEQLARWGRYREMIHYGESLLSIVGGPQVGKLRLELGRAHRYVGDVANAREHLDAIAKMGSGEVDETVRAWSLYEFGLLHGDLADDKEALRYFSRALRLFQRLDLVAGLVAVRASGARIASEHGNYAAAERRFRTALAVSAFGIDARRERAWALFDYGRLLTNNGKHFEAKKIMLQALRLFRRDLQLSTGAAWARYGLGLVLLNLEHWQAARRTLLSARRHFNQLGNRGGAAWATHLLGRVSYREGRYNESRHLYRTMLNEYVAEDNPRGLAYALEGLARLEAIEGSAEKAAMLFGGAAKLRAENSSPLPSADGPEYDAALALVRSRLGDQEFEIWRQHGHHLAMDVLIKETIPAMPEVS